MNGIAVAYDGSEDANTAVELVGTFTSRHWVAVGGTNLQGVWFVVLAATVRARCVAPDARAQRRKVRWTVPLGAVSAVTS